MHKVIIDASNRMKYSSFYIKGLEEVFGKENVSFSTKYFKDLDRKSDTHSFDHYMAFILQDGNNVKKIIIDYRDKNTLKKNAYNWCDAYAKINLKKELSKDFSAKKIISIPPGFGISLWNFWQTTYFCFKNLAKCKFSPLESYKVHFNDYFSLYFRRSNIEAYYKNETFIKTPKDSQKNYVFFIATLWQHESCYEGANAIRKRFIELCKENEKIEFEGGFYSNPSHPQFNDFRDIIFLKRYSIKEYINKTLLSSFVFNTPAVFNCHGWKLGEFLAMGKAIISTPFFNDLPENLIHGKDIHFVNNDSELEEAINLLLVDQEYKKQLEDGAKLYYDKYVSPKSVIQHILKHL